MKETNRMRLIQIRMSELGYRMFRNNTAKAWVGKSVRFTRPQTITVKSGDVLVTEARVLHAGLCVGSSDLIGWKPVTITPDMVGKQIAVFTAAEIKTDTGRATAEQINFIEQVNKAGGIGNIYRNVEEVK